MTNKNQDNFDIDSLLNGFLSNEVNIYEASLKELFDARLSELQISMTTALSILQIESRPLNGILNGNQKLVDFTNLIKIANFLQIPKEKVIQLYINELEKTYDLDLAYPPSKIEFINKNFDLAVLKKANFINSINDYPEIEKKINSYFGFKTIFEYRKPHVDVAFSAGLIKPKNELSRSMWIESATNIFEGLNNPYPFDRQKLIDFFPEIRWHSTNVELGLVNIIKTLYKMGVTVIYQDSLPTLHLRGATFAVNQKPCIVLTNYRGFYPTLWFALIHELFHVLFDWDEIKNSKYQRHVSDSEASQLTVLEKEKEADDFAREYLFSIEKTLIAKSFIHDNTLVEEYSKNNHVHPSFIYVFFANDFGKNNKGISWMRAHKYNPQIDSIIDHFDNPWNNPKPISQYIKSLKMNIFNL